MSEEKDIETTAAFYWQLFNSSKYVLLIVLLATAIGLYVLPNIDASYVVIILLALTLIKIGFIIALSFNQLMKIIGQSHLLSHVLVLFGYLIILIVFSFAIDYTVLHLIDSAHFKINNSSGSNGLLAFFNMSYFSLITFSSVGYGDIVPITVTAKTLVVLEVALRFFVLVFGIANVNRIRVNNLKT
ncbi:ion channel [Robiginitalea biformata]|uniref:ion channel n=1 Tax=Robiginitalea biformata TaxID=252307 RepID=UPI003B58BCEB